MDFFTWYIKIGRIKMSTSSFTQFQILTSICIRAISLAWASAILASVCSLACLAKKSTSVIGCVSGSSSGCPRDRVAGLAGAAGVAVLSSCRATFTFFGCFFGCLLLVDTFSESELGLSVSEFVSFMKQIWRFMPTRFSCYQQNCECPFERLKSILLCYHGKMIVD